VPIALRDRISANEGSLARRRARSRNYNRDRGRRPLVVRHIRRSESDRQSLVSSRENRAGQRRIGKIAGHR